LGKDPECKYTAGGTVVTTCSLATSESWKDKDGNKQEKTDWHNLVMFGKTAENFAKFFHKGDMACVEGAVNYETYEKDGQTKYITKVKVERFHFVGKTSGGSSAAPAEQSSDDPSGMSDVPF